MSEPGLVHPPLQPVRAIIQRALDEDIGWGDVTTDHSVPADQWSRGVLLAKQDAVLCGGRVFAETFAMVDPAVKVELLVPDGARVAKGDVAARLEGPTRALLTAERTALNFVQRLSGIATSTAAFVARLHGLPTRLIDTRKTTPGLRLLEKYAVRAGGGHNHRFNLADAVLMKDNHLAALRSRGLDLADAVRSIRQRVPHTMQVEVEVTSLEQIDAGPGRRRRHHPARQHVERRDARGGPAHRRTRSHRVLRQRHPRDGPRARRDRRGPDLVRRADPLVAGGGLQPGDRRLTR